jgi:hypothetical protein
MKKLNPFFMQALHYRRITESRALPNSIFEFQIPGPTTKKVFL